MSGFIFFSFSPLEGFEWVLGREFRELSVSIVALL